MLHDHRLLTFQAAHAAASAASEFLLANPGAWILSASRAAADDLVRRVEAPGLLGVERLTLLQAAAEIATPLVAAEGLAPLSRLAQEALAARITHDARVEGQLVYFREVASMPGFGRALARTLDDLRLGGIHPEDLLGCAKPHTDLAELLSRYQQALREQGLADAAWMLRAAARVLRDGSRTRFADRPLLLFEVALRHQAQREFAEALVARAGSTLAVALQADTRSIAGWSEVLGVEPESRSAAVETQLDTARAQLFESRPARSQPADGTLEMFSSPGEDLESVEIARRILKLAAEGTRFDQMAILLRNPDRYQPLVEEALRRAGIPGYFSRGTARPDPSGRAFLALLHCRAEHLPASRFAEYLSLGQVPPADAKGEPMVMAAAAAAPDDELLSRFSTEPPPESEEPIEEAASTEGAVVHGTLRVPGAWEKLLVDASVVGGGPDRWRKRLAGLTRELEKQREDLQDQEHPAWTRLTRQIEHLGHLQRFALPLIGMLAALPDQAVWGEWLQRLGELARRSLRKPDTVLAVLAEMEPMSDVGPLSIEEVAYVLADRLRFLRRDPPKRRYGSVFVGSVEEARGRAFEVVFLPGLAEGLFPKKQLEDALLLDNARAELSDALLTRRDRVDQERLLLHTAAAAASRKLVVSFPRMDVIQARPRVPSFYALELPKAAEGSLPPLDQFKRRTEADAPARLEWPAPQHAAEAVDDLEYDLASWKQTLGMETDRQGRLRYILLANPHVARSIRTRWLKWNKKTWGHADGLIELDPEAQAAIEKHRLSERPYSPSALQHFAACPYRFYLQAIAKLAPREEKTAVEQIDPLTRGALFHETQFALFRRLRQEGLLPLSTWKLQDVLAIADQVLDEVAARWADELCPAIDRVWETEIGDIRTDLRGWLHEISFDADWEPVRFELSFGLEKGEDHDPESSADPVRLDSGALLRGSIDLVEKHRTRNVLRVTDHKTGKVPDALPAYVGGGQFLQPMLYGWAAARLLETPVESARLYYCTQRGGFRVAPVELSERSQNFGRRLLQIIDESLKTGFLPAAPRKDACTYCDYRPVCGPYEEMRMGRKDKNALELVNEIRRMP